MTKMCKYSTNLPFNEKISSLGGGVAQWVARLTYNQLMHISHKLKPHQRPSLLSTGWFQERIQA